MQLCRGRPNGRLGGLEMIGQFENSKDGHWLCKEIFFRNVTMPSCANRVDNAMDYQWNINSRYVHLISQSAQKIQPDHMIQLFRLLLMTTILLPKSFLHLVFSFIGVENIPKDLRKYKVRLRSILNWYPKVRADWKI